MQATSAQDFIKLRADSPLPIMVDFYADWCGPCQMLTPVLEQLAQEVEGKYDIVKVDIDESEDIATELGITSIPTLITYKNGEVADRMAGFQSKDAILAKLESL